MSKWQKHVSFSGDVQVCSLLYLRDFGEQSPSATVGSPLGLECNHAEDIEEFKTHLRYCVDQWNKGYQTYSENSWQNKSVHRVACIQAMTCSFQPKANEYLKELGFKKTGPLKKLKHAESDLFIWLITPKKFLKAIDWKP